MVGVCWSVEERAARDVLAGVKAARVALAGVVRRIEAR
jgi:hypothetical protein